MLYKFYEIPTSRRLCTNRLASILVNPTIKFTPIRTLNDPNEFKYFLKFDKAETQQLLGLWSGRHPNGLPEDFQKWIQTLDEEAISQIQAEFRLFRRSSFQIASFSVKHSSVLLWSHYAGGIGGFAVIYRERLKTYLSEHHPQLMFGHVQYVEEPPSIFEQRDPASKIKADIFFTKQKEWAYESEFRFIQQSTSNVSTLYAIPSSCIFGVILGINMNQKLRQKINRICTNMGYKCFEVHNYSQSYKLMTVEVLNEERLLITRA